MAGSFLPLPWANTGAPRPTAEADRLRLTWIDGQPIMGRRFRPLLLRIHHVRPTVDDIVVDTVLDVGAAIGNAEDALSVGLVLGKQPGRVAVAVEVALAEYGVDYLGNDLPGGTVGLREYRPLGIGMPGPLVAEPQRRQDVQLAGSWPRLWTVI